MNNPFFQELSYSNAVHFKEYIDRLSMFNPTIAQLRAEQMRIEEMKQRAALDIFHGCLRKSSLAKIEEDVAMAYEALCRKYEHSFCSAFAITVADIITQYRQEHPDPAPAPAPVFDFPHSIFREFYYKVVINKKNLGSIYAVQNFKSAKRHKPSDGG